jgi:hypothetical protein
MRSIFGRPIEFRARERLTSRHCDLAKMLLTCRGFAQKVQGGLCPPQCVLLVGTERGGRGWSEAKPRMVTRHGYLTRQTLQITSSDARRGFPLVQPRPPVTRG